jgi:hypothetical protein
MVEELTKGDGSRLKAIRMRALVNEVIAWARRRGLQQLVLDVGTANAAARSLYESRGFIETGVTKALPPPRQQVKELEMEIELQYIPRGRAVTNQSGRLINLE